ncbi:GntR family transcriptional regulator [Paenibacillus yanchengensis]|uniref:GntR family transcriptional regulator n=1 Tax=Paenibacillus yanchengensis TaxID=2035833 RepID=A0ABW4YNW1_9BACL
MEMNKVNNTGLSQAVSTRDAVYLKLREQILNLELLPGTPLSENESAQIFQVSRTPVRESFLRLSQEGLVQVLPQRGTFVSLIDSELVEEARFMREHLESAVIKLACKQLDDSYMAQLEQNIVKQQVCLELQDNKEMFLLDQQFHRLLFEGCQKLHTWFAMQQLTVHLDRSRALMLVSELQWHHLFEQHQQMVIAIRAGDMEQADEVMHQHLQLNIADQAKLKEKFPNYYK